jgi:hypothetical protein
MARGATTKVNLVLVRLLGLTLRQSHSKEKYWVLANARRMRRMKLVRLTLRMSWHVHRLRHSWLVAVLDPRSGSPRSRVFGVRESRKVRRPTPTKSRDGTRPCPTRPPSNS